MENRVALTAEQSREDLSSTAPHTSGPWSVSNESLRDMNVWNGVAITSNCNANGETLDGPIKNGGINIARVMGLDAKANARLIAAAPEMLAALQFILDHITDPARGPRDLYPAFGLNSGRAIEMASAAIAKATGHGE